MVKKKPSRKSRKKKMMHPVVVVSIPRYAKLVVKRKAHNPYMMDVTDTTPNDKTHHVWYSDDYDPNKAGQGGGM